MLDVRRRQFISLLGGMALAWPTAADAQQAPMPVVGFLNQASPDQDQGRARAFRQGLSEAGYVEGRDVAIEYRWGNGQVDPLKPMAADLVRRQVSVIAAGSDPAAIAAKAITDTIPIVFAGGGDPVKLGLVASLNRPGANVTGVVNLNIQLGPKRLQLLHELVPSARVIFLLLNPTNPNAETISNDLQEAARSLGLETQSLHASTDRDLDAVFAKLAEMRASALVIGADVFFTTRSKKLAALTTPPALPAISQSREFATAGGLASYGTDVREQYRLVGLYIGRVLKGTKVADLPVQLATKLELVINLKAAKSLGVTVPLPVLGRADEVIE
jgi:putative tryptophan/tyrosine transport system substrate-binding protein